LSFLPDAAGIQGEATYASVVATRPDLLNTGFTLSAQAPGATRPNGRLERVFKTYNQRI